MNHKNITYIHNINKEFNNISDMLEWVRNNKNNIIRGDIIKVYNIMYYYDGTVFCAVNNNKIFKSRCSFCNTGLSQDNIIFKNKISKCHKCGIIQPTYKPMPLVIY